MKRTHEKTDMNPAYVAYFAAGLIVVAVLVQLGSWWMFHQFEQAQARRQTPPALVETPAPVPEPRLQISPQQDLEEMIRQEDEVLSTYGWIDRGRGIARIPIDRAMQLLLEKEKR